MSDFYWIWAYVSAVWSTVIVNCAQPTNWERCLQVDDWLVPWVRDVGEMYQKGAYYSEKSILKQAE